MLRVKRKTFEKVIFQITSSDVEEFMREFSRDIPFFYSLVKDISEGKESPNYHVLKKVAKDKKVGEQFIIGRAKFILSCFAPDEPKEDYYKTLDVSPTASTEEVRSSWLNLVKTYHPDKIGDQGLDIIKRINEAYEVLGNPEKRDEYDSRCFPTLPVKLGNPWMEIGLGKIIYSVSLTALVFTGIVYLAKLSSPFYMAEEKKEFAKRKIKISLLLKKKQR